MVSFVNRESLQGLERGIFSFSYFRLVLPDNMEGLFWQLEVNIELRTLSKNLRVLEMACVDFRSLRSSSSLSAKRRKFFSSCTSCLQYRSLWYDRVHDPAFLQLVNNLRLLINRFGHQTKVQIFKLTCVDLPSCLARLWKDAVPAEISCFDDCA